MMKIYFTKISLVFVIGCLFGCQNNSPVDLMASNICDCWRPLAEVYLKMKNLSEEGSMEALQALQSRIEQYGATAEECTTALENKYGEELEQQEDAIKKAMATICPEVADVLEEGAEID